MEQARNGPVGGYAPRQYVLLVLVADDDVEEVRRDLRRLLRLGSHPLVVAYGPLHGFRVGEPVVAGLVCLHPDLQDSPGDQAVEGPGVPVDHVPLESVVLCLCGVFSLPL